MSSFGVEIQQLKDDLGDTAEGLVEDESFLSGCVSAMVALTRRIRSMLNNLGYSLWKDMQQ